MNKYYLSDGRAKDGPFTIEELRIKGVRPEALVWSEGMPDWSRADQVSDLKTLFVGPPPLPNEVSKSKKSPTGIYIAMAAFLLVVLLVYLWYQNSKREKELVQVQEALIQKGKDEEDKNRKEAERLQKENNAKAEQAAIADRQIFFRNSWQKYIRLSGSKYMTSRLGGISDLDLTLTNTSEYPLANVEAEVDYIKSNGGIHKTEKVTFNIIPAGTSKTLPAPNSDRGTSVEIRIQRVSAPAFQFCYDRDYRMESGDRRVSTSPNGISGNPADPWKCN